MTESPLQKNCSNPLLSLSTSRSLCLANFLTTTCESKGISIFFYLYSCNLSEQSLSMESFFLIEGFSGVDLTNLFF